LLLLNKIILDKHLQAALHFVFTIAVYTYPKSNLTPEYGVKCIFLNITVANGHSLMRRSYSDKDKAFDAEREATATRTTAIERAHAAIANKKGKHRFV
jgi:hypothetical protein